MNKAADKAKEPWYEQAASFIGFFVLLLVFKSFFIPLFVIPTGSMAETLAGAHARHTCPNCGYEYQVGFFQPGQPQPALIRCPNCRLEEAVNTRLHERLRPTIGDRITVLGWPYGLGGQTLAPERWDVVVFRNPQDPEMNYIKRLIGKPGEKIEIVDGDIFVDDEIAQKTHAAQQSLWFVVYDHNFAPAEASNAETPYLPCWRPRSADNGWQDLAKRRIVFDGASRPYGQVYFSTNPRVPEEAGLVEDVYGYNPTQRRDRAGRLYPTDDRRTVSDVRLSTTLETIAGAGFLELALQKYGTRVSAVFYPADGKIRLYGGDEATGDRVEWGVIDWAYRPGQSIALSVADYQAVIEINGEVVLRSTSEQFGVDIRDARQRALDPQRPLITMAGERVNAALRNVRIERDVFYRYELIGNRPPRRPGNAVRNNPFQLDDGEYFVLGDNSPFSHDGRLWDSAGPHLRGGDYKIGTVPADQMIGRAFFVYWPGFLPLPGGGWAVVPDLGRVRWIY